MPGFVTLTFDLTTSTTTVAEDGRPTWTGPEPDGILGLCACGCLFSRCGSTVTYRVIRSRAAAPLEVTS